MMVDRVPEDKQRKMVHLYGWQDSGSPKEVHILIPQTWESIRFHDSGELRLQRELRVLSR